MWFLNGRCMQTWSVNGWCISKTRCQVNSGSVSGLSNGRWQAARVPVLLGRLHVCRAPGQAERVPVPVGRPHVPLGSWAPPALLGWFWCGATTTTGLVLVCGNHNHGTGSGGGATTTTGVVLVVRLASTHHEGGSGGGPGPKPAASGTKQVNGGSPSAPF